MDEILQLFLETQREEGLRLSAESDLLHLEPLDLQRYVATFRCRGLIRDEHGRVCEHERFAVGIRFPESYHRDVVAPLVLSWLAPDEIWHPNIRPPYICVGDIAPGTPLVELLYRCFEVITFNNVCMRENDALNHEACAWSRQHRDRLPIDPRPIKRRRMPSPAAVGEGRP